MDADTPMTPPKLTRAKRTLFFGILFVLLLLMTELIAYGAYWAVTKKRLSFGKVNAERLGIAGADAHVRSALQGDSRVLAVHPYLGYVYDPKAATQPFVDFHGFPISSFGFIDNKDPIHKRAPDKVIVGIVGGSVAYWFSAQGYQTLENELKKHPQFAGKEFVFVRLAMGGYKQPQQLLAVNYILGLGGEFDLIVNIDGFNEVVLPACHNVHSGVYAYFPYCWSAVAAGVPDPESQKLIGEISYLQSKRQDCAKFFSAKLFYFSSTMQLIWHLRDQGMDRDIGKIRVALQGRKSDSMSFCATGPKNPVADEDAMYSDLVTTWKRCSTSLHRVCQAHGIQYFHFLQPNQYVEGSKPMGDAEKRIAYDPVQPYVGSVVKGYPRLIQQGKDLAEQGVNFRDLTMIFAEHPEPIYNDNACHFDRAGNAIMAREIAHTILQSQSGGE